MNKISRSAWGLALFFYIIYALLMPTKGCEYDMSCWADWAAYISAHGLGNAYGSGANYLPGHFYELKLYTLLFDTPRELSEHIYYLKYFTLLFDVLGALLVCSLTVETSRQNLLLIALLLNPAYLHNDLMWGQFDSVFSTLAFASFLAAYNRKFLLSALLYLLSFNFKMQAIIFFPGLILLMCYRSGFNFKWKKLATGFLLLVLVQVVILLPFILKSHLLQVFWNVKGLGGSYGYISLNASNVWYLLIEGGDLRWMTDRVEFFGISLKHWGLGLAATSYFIVLFPLIRSVFLLLKKKSADINFARLLSIFGLSVLVFFYFNTQMHERYTFPAFLFLAAFSFLTDRWWIYGIFSLAYFLNNEERLQSIKQFNYESFVFDSRFTSMLYGVLILALFFHLFYPGRKTGLLRDNAAL